MIPNVFLIVDDAEQYRDAMYKMVRKAFPEAGILEAPNGRTALKLMAHGVGFVITDGQMEVMGGIELIRRIRTTNKKIPILLVTADVATANLGREAGASEVITKPFRMEVFVSTIRKMLEE